MENLFLEAVKIVNPFQAVLTGLIVYFFYNRQKDEFKTEIKEVRAEIKSESERINSRIDNLYQIIFSYFKKDAA